MNNEKISKEKVIKIIEDVYTLTTYKNQSVYQNILSELIDAKFNKDQAVEIASFYIKNNDDYKKIRDVVEYLSGALDKDISSNEIEISKDLYKRLRFLIESVLKDIDNNKKQ